MKQGLAERAKVWPGGRGTGGWHPVPQCMGGWHTAIKPSVGVVSRVGGGGGKGNEREGNGLIGMWGSFGLLRCVRRRNGCGKQRVALVKRIGASAGTTRPEGGGWVGGDGNSTDELTTKAGVREKEAIKTRKRMGRRDSTMVAPLFCPHTFLTTPPQASQQS